MEENNFIESLNNFEGHELKILINEDGEPLFELYSVGVALGYGRVKIVKGKEYQEIQKSRIEKTMKNAEIIGFPHGVETYLTEEEVYDFMLEAHTEPCKRFKKWLTNEVIPQIRKHGAYISDDGADQNYLQFAYGQLEQTFLNTLCEDVKETYDNAMEFYSDNKNRLPYYKTESSKNRKDKKHNSNKKYTVTETKIIVSKKIKDILEKRKQKLIGDNKFGSAYELQQAMLYITETIKQINDNKNRGKLASSTRKCNQLKQENEELRELNKELSPLEDFTTINVHRVLN